jgi:hypothetical protein
MESFAANKNLNKKAFLLIQISRTFLTITNRFYYSTITEHNSIGKITAVQHFLQKLIAFLLTAMLLFSTVTLSAFHSGKHFEKI